MSQNSFSLGGRDGTADCIEGTKDIVTKQSTSEAVCEGACCTTSAAGITAVYWQSGDAAPDPIRLHPGQTANQPTGGSV